MNKIGKSKQAFQSTMETQCCASIFGHENFIDAIIHCIMTQYLFHNDLKVFREHGEEAVQKDIMQLHMMDTFKPLEKDKSSAKEKRAAILSLILLIEKKDWRIKDRACADGRKPRECTKKMMQHHLQSFLINLHNDCNQSS